MDEKKGREGSQKRGKSHLPSLPLATPMESAENSKSFPAASHMLRSHPLTPPTFSLSKKKYWWSGNGRTEAAQLRLMRH